MAYVSSPFPSTAEMGYIRMVETLESRVSSLAAHINDQNAQIVALRQELARYKEREKTMGWNQN